MADRQYSLEELNAMQDASSQPEYSLEDLNAISDPSPGSTPQEYSLDQLNAMQDPIQPQVDNSSSGWLDTISNIGSYLRGSTMRGVAGATDWVFDNTAGRFGYTDPGIEGEFAQQTKRRDEAAKALGIDGSVTGTAKSIPLGVVQSLGEYAAAGFNPLNFAAQQFLARGGEARANADLSQSDPNVKEDNLGTIGLIRGGSAAATSFLPARSAEAPLLSTGERILDSAKWGAIGGALDAPAQVVTDKLGAQQDLANLDTVKQVAKQIGVGAATGAVTGAGMGAIGAAKKALNPDPPPDTTSPGAMALKAQRDAQLEEVKKAVNPVSELPAIQKAAEVPVADLGDVGKSLVSEPRLLDQDLPQIEKWMDGQDFVPGLKSSASELRKQVMFPITLAQKDIDSARAWDSVELGISTANKVKMALGAKLQPLTQLPSEEKAAVSSALRDYRRAAVKFNDTTKQPAPELTPDALKAQYGFNDAQVSAFQSVREWSKDSLGIMIEQLKQRAKAPGLTTKESAAIAQAIDRVGQEMSGRGYVPFIREGKNFQLTVRDGTGNVVESKTYDTKSELKSAMTQWRSQGIPREQMFSKALPKGSAGSTEMFLPPDVAQAIGEVISPNDRRADLKIPTGMGKHFKNADLVKGESEDIAKAASQYTESLANWIGKDVRRRGMNAAIDNLKNKEKFQAAEYWKRYAEDLDKPDGKLSNATTKFIVGWQLAGVPSSAALNFSQTFTTTLPLLAEEHGVVGAGRLLAKAAAEGLKIKQMGDVAYANSSPQALARMRAIKEAQVAGVLDAELLGTLSDTAQGRTGSSLYQKAMTPFSAVEKANRYMAFLAKYDGLVKKGVGGSDAAQQAIKFVQDTQFIQGRTNVPQFMRGPIAKNAFLFKSFSGNMLKFLRDRLSQRQYKALTLSLGAQTALGGAMALPFAKGALALVDLAREAANPEDEGTVNSVRKALPRKASTAALYGLPALAGVNLSGGVGLGDIIPELDMNPAMQLAGFAGGPGVGIANNMYRASQAYGNNVPTTALSLAAPRMFRGPIKAYEYASTGKVNNIKGDAILEDSGISKVQKAKEVASLALGFPIQRQVQFYEDAKRRAKLIESARDNDNINIRFANAIKQKDSAKIRDIIKESADSMTGPEVSRKPINKQSVMMYLLPPDIRDLAKAPNEVKPKIAEMIKEGRDRKSALEE